MRQNKINLDIKDNVLATTKNNRNITLNTCQRTNNEIFLNGKKIECNVFSDNLTNNTGQGYVINIDNANIVYIELPNYYQELQSALDKIVAFMTEAIITPASASNGLGMASTYPIIPSTALIQKSNEAIIEINKLKVKLP